MSNTDTTAIVTSTTNFKAKSGEGQVLIDEGTATEENAYATGESGGTLTIPLANRGLEGGTPQTHAASSTIKGDLSAGMWNDLIDSVVNVLDKTTGALDTTKVTDLTSSQSLTNKTLTDSTNNVMAKSLKSATTTVDVSAATAPSTGQVLTATDSTHATWQSSTAATDGWTADTNTWTYASASTFTVSGVDVTAQFTKGTRIKLTQTSAKYFVVVSSSFSTNTTVTVTGGSDYSLANAAITSPYYSYQASPQGYPTWFNYAPTFTGFSVNPTGYTAKFNVIGSMCTLFYSAGTVGTSNSTSFTMTAPIAATTSATNHIYWARLVDNSSFNNIGDLLINGSTTITFEKTVGTSASFTASGTKDAFFTISYDF